MHLYHLHNYYLGIELLRQSSPELSRSESFPCEASCNQLCWLPTGGTDSKSAAFDSRRQLYPTKLGTDPIRGLRWPSPSKAGCTPTVFRPAPSAKFRVARSKNEKTCEGNRRHESKVAKTNSYLYFS